MKKNSDENDLGPPFRAVMLSLLIILVFVLSVMPVSAYSDNWIDYIGEDAFTPINITVTEDGGVKTFTIRTAEGLAWVAKDINAGNNNTSKFILADNIDLKGHDWMPIGECIDISGSPDIDHTFRGTFDGNGKTISNLYINNSSSSADNQGLFGYALNANISNVNLINVSVTSSSINIGGLVGRYDLDENVHITISNCSVTGNVSGDRYYIGGLIGYNGASNTGGITIENCYAAGDVSGNQAVGGLIGENYAVGSSVITIENCYAAGNVSGDGYAIGGLIGYNYAGDTGGITIENCYATGDVSGKDDSIGGLIGENYAGDTGGITIENCYATGDVSGIKLTSGLVGWVGWNTADDEAKIYVNNSAALNQYVNCSEDSGESYVGRIVGGWYGAGENAILKYNYAWDGMTNYSQPFTENISHNQWNGSDVLNKSVWCNKTFFKETLGWDFENTWDMARTSIENDDGISYPLPYLKSLGREDTLRQKVIHLAPKYNVNFNGNGNTDGTMPVQIFIYHEPQSITPNAYIKTGHTFEGWSKTPNGEKVYDDKQSITITTPEDITLYAVWTSVTPPPTTTPTTAPTVPPTDPYYGEYIDEGDDGWTPSVTFQTPTVKPTQIPTEVPTETPTLNLVEPTAKPTQTQSPMPVIGILAGLCAAVIVLRRK